MTDNQDFDQPAQQWNSDYPGGTQQVPQYTPPAEQPLVAQQRPRLVPGILAGLVAAVAATVAWYFIVALSGWQIGFLAVGVGFVIGLAMRFGAGGVGSRQLQIAACVVTVLAMFVAEYLIARHAIGEYFVSQGQTDPLRMFIPFGDMVSVVGDTVRADPLTLLFWVIALAAAWRATQPTHHQEQVVEPAPEDRLPQI